MSAWDSKGSLEIRPGEIHLWLIYYDAIEDEGLHAQYRALLNVTEKLKEPRFHFARDRRRYLVTRAALRTILSRYAPVAPEEWEFKTNEYGRPQIDKPEVENLQLAFNISHTHSLIAIGITRGRELGVDVENVVAREVSVEIADRYFAPDEVAALYEVASEGQHDRFFEYWTFKESYIKARGMGLSLPLDKFSFLYPHERAVQIAIHPDLEDASDRWEFWQCRPTREYLVAVCAERRDDGASRVIVRRAVPLVSEEIVETEFLRRSHPGVPPARE
jgi:4'-phosphopantetheinyl transferase